MFFFLTSTALSKTRSILNWNVTVKDTFAITQAHILESERQVRSASANAVRLQGMLDNARSRVRQYRDDELDAEEAMSEIASDIDIED